MTLRNEKTYDVSKQKNNSVKISLCPKVYWFLGPAVTNCHKMGGVNATENYSLTLVEARGLESRCWPEELIPSEALK